jgi:hypothetical protein
MAEISEERKAWFKSMAEISEELKAWFKSRVETINSKVTVYDILRRQGIALRHTTDRLEQIPCPFHGKDEHPSARVYPADAKSPSHIWCFVCREHWDAIRLWKKFGGDESKKFHQVLCELEKAFNITPPEVSREAFSSSSAAASTPDAASKETFERLYASCESRLLSVQGDFRSANDMAGYLLIGSILDKLFYSVTEGTTPFGKGIEVLTVLRQKISDRIRKGYESTSPPTDSGDGGSSVTLDF